MEGNRSVPVPGRMARRSRVPAPGLRSGSAAGATFLLALANANCASAAGARDTAHSTIGMLVIFFYLLCVVGILCGNAELRERSRLVIVTVACCAGLFSFGSAPSVPADTAINVTKAAGAERLLCDGDDMLLARIKDAELLRQDERLARMQAQSALQEAAKSLDTATAEKDECLARIEDCENMLKEEQLAKTQAEATLQQMSKSLDTLLGKLGPLQAERDALLLRNKDAELLLKDERFARKKAYSTLQETGRLLGESRRNREACQGDLSAAKLECRNRTRIGSACPIATLPDSGLTKALASLAWMLVAAGAGALAMAIVRSGNEQGQNAPMSDPFRKDAGVQAYLPQESVEDTVREPHPSADSNHLEEELVVLHAQSPPSPPYTPDHMSMVVGNESGEPNDSCVEDSGRDLSSEVPDAARLDDAIFSNEPSSNGELLEAHTIGSFADSAPAHEELPTVAQMESLLLEVSTREHEDFVSELQVRLETLERNMADASAMQGCVAAESEELRKEVQRQRDSSSASAARIANLESELLSALSQLERCNVMIPKIMDRMRNKPQEIRVVPRSKTARASSPAPGKAGNPSAPSCHPSVLSNEALLAALEQEVANAGQLELDISERSQRTVAGDLMKAMFGGAKHAK